ncbi:conserved hypothetical protein [Vibrio crassostreae]|nr:conserved hypothetical protein [Vibrio crassostreae]
MTKTASKDQKRKQKKKQKAAKKNMEINQRRGRVVFGCNILQGEWGILVHQADVPMEKLHPQDKDQVISELAKMKDDGVLASVKRRSDGSFAIVHSPERFDTADIAYEDGEVDPADVMADNDLHQYTKFLGFVVCNGNGMFVAPDGETFTNVPEKAYLFEEIPPADQKAQEYERGFTSMLFDTGHNIILAVVKPE